MSKQNGSRKVGKNKRSPSMAAYKAQEAAAVQGPYLALAAALTGRTLDDVLRWVANPLSNTDPGEILREHPHAAPFWHGLLHGALHGDDRTVLEPRQLREPQRAVVGPLVESTGVNPNLMVLAVGAGSLMFSHVNDSAFWMFKEYFGLSLKDTFRSWTAMETLAGTFGIVFVLILSLFVG